MDKIKEKIGDGFTWVLFECGCIVAVCAIASAIGSALATFVSWIVEAIRWKR